MATSLDRVRVKIQRAKEHLAYLEAVHARWRDPSGHKVSGERDPETRKMVYYLVKTADIPDSIPAATGDVLNNLRSALDHVAYQLVFKDTHGRGVPMPSGKDPFRHVQFPIFDSPSEYKAGKMRQIKGMLKPSIDAIDRVKPYKTGNDTLWFLSRLNNIDKHRTLLMMGTGQSVDLGGYTVRKMFKEAFPLATEVPQISAFFRAADLCKAGEPLFFDAPDAEFDKDLRFSFHVAFDEAGIPEREPLLETLQGMTDLVDNLVGDFAPLL